MASSKEMTQTTRPLNQHRSSLSTASASGIMSRQSHSRTNSHSVLSASLKENNRVTRRKSMTNTNANVAAVAAALKDTGGDGAAAMPIAAGSRRNTASKSAAARAAVVDSLLSPPASLPTSKFHMDKEGVSESAIEDGSADENDKTKTQKSRGRRASDGQPLKERRKSNRVELRCEKCGKGYKHSSCLTKHLWEHTPEWSYTSKLLISKHQQVQLLEAASVLVTMNETKGSENTPPESVKDINSEPESAPSPSASGYSDSRQSSADTTPPPHIEGYGALSATSGSFPKRYSNGDGFGRSYQSAPSTNPLVTGSMPTGSGLSHFRQRSQDRRPPSSGRNTTGQEDRDLAAAVELLSCSFGSNGNGSAHKGSGNGHGHGHSHSGSRTINLPSDVPPVPPLPTQYLDQATSLSSTGFLGSYPRQPESFTRGEMRHDIKTEDNDSVMDDDDFDRRSRSRSDEDDDGVFGRMEE